MPSNFDFLFPQIPILEKIVRPLIVYVFLLGAFRIFGKRQLGQLSSFDLIVLLIISNIVQNAMIGNDTSLVGGIIGATTILVANFALAYLTFHFPRFDRLIEGEPTVLIQNGQILYENLKKELLSEQELRQALSKNQIDPDTDLPALKKVELEPDGQITIVRQARFRRTAEKEQSA
jgi:uncharacterized membrane protein YcaP (DUF421 family)